MKKGTQPDPQVDRGASSRRLASEFLSRAEEAKKSQERSEATLLYRQAIYADATWNKAWNEAARYQIYLDSASSAEEILAFALQSNGANIDALEMYLEVLAKRDRPRSFYAWARQRLVEDLPHHQDAHRGALDFVIPYEIGELFPILAASNDPVSRLVVDIVLAYRDGAFSGTWLNEKHDGLSEGERGRAHAIALIATGNHESALQILNRLEIGHYPINSVRRAIRRSLNSGTDAITLGYLTEYLRIRRDDSWALKKKAELSNGNYSNERLTRSGFPFPWFNETPVYEPDRNKVLYLLHNSLPYHSVGYSTRSHGLLSGLKDLGWDVDGVTRLGYPMDMPGFETSSSIPMISSVDSVQYRRLLGETRIERKDPFHDYSQRYSESLSALAVSERPAIIHAASNYINGITAVSTANRLGLHSIYEVRGLWEITRASRNPEWSSSRKFKFMVRMETDAAEGASHVFALTESLKNELIRRGIKSEKITVLPNGVDTSRFLPRKRDKDLERRLGLEDRTVIGYVGSMLNYEGLGLLIEAAGRLSRTRDDFRMLFVGDGAELDEFREQVNEAGLNRIVIFTGRVSHADVEKYYSLIDITPFPRMPVPVCEMVSPLKPFEAMAMGKAVVASDVSALSEFVKPGLNGLLHRKGDVDDLETKLRNLLDDEDLRRTLGNQARDWVVSNRDWRIIARKVTDVYTQLLSGSTN